MKTFYTKFLLFTFFISATSGIVSAQCTGNTTSGAFCTRSNFYYGEILPNQGCGNYTTVTPYSPGEYFRMPVLPGACYTVNTCGASIDTQLGAFEGNLTTGPFAYNDDNGPICSGTAASMDMVPTFNDYARIDVRQYNCQPGGSASITVQVRQNNNLVITSSSADMCAGQTRALTATPSAVVPFVAAAGDGGTFTGTGVSGTTFTAPTPAGASANYVITYTYGYCSTSQMITVYRAPTTAIAGINQTIPCSGTTATLAGNTPVYGTGVWTLISGTGTITNPSNPTSGVTGLTPGASSVFRWTITNGPCSASSSDVTITSEIDTTNPIAPILTALTDECSVTAVPPTTTDNCAGTVTGSTTDPTSYSSQGSYTINWTFDDGNGNSIVVPQTVIIDDVTDPVTPTLAALTDECSVTAIAPTTTDNCAGTVTGSTTDPTSYSSQGSYTINWTFDDGNGNSIVVPQTVIIDDVTDPVTPTLAALTDECSVTAIAPTTTDNCSGTVTGTTTDPLTYTTNGSYTINWTFDDGNGNSIVVPQTVTISDVTDPDTPTLAALTDECSLTATAPTTTDNCAGTVTGTTTDPTSYSTQGSYTINWTFDDGNGNSIVVPQTVTIDDVTDPTTPTLAALTDECSVTAIAPTTTDNCAGTITGTTTDPLTYTVEGSYTINWTFDDGNGNSIVVPQTVTISDVTDPDTPTLAALTDECSVTATAPTTTDNCAGTITGTTTDPLTYTVEGSYTINWTFDDGNGNSIVAPQTVTIDDVTDPTTPTLAALTDECSVTATAPTTTDNCAGTITGTTTDPLTYTAEGSYTINWTFDDGNGNSIVVPQTVTIDDVTAPVPDMAILADLTDNCEITSLTDPTATDNCSGTVSVSHDATLPITASTVITWTYDDGNGNTATQMQNVTITGIDVSTTVEASGIEITANNTSATSYQWIDCGNGNSIIAGETGISYETTTSGDYAVIITEGSCVDTSACVNIVNPLGIKDLNSVNALLYPNPTQDVLNVKIDAVIQSIEVLDMLGRVIAVNADLKENKIDVSNLEPGKYTLKIVTETQGTTLKEFMVVK